MPPNFLERRNYLLISLLFNSSHGTFLHILDFVYVLQGRSQDFSKGGSPSGDRRLYMVYTAALPRVSAGSVVLSRHEGPY